MRILTGSLKGHFLEVPNKTRPTLGKVRAAVFNMCQNHIEGAHFLDIYAGSGAMGIEALSRGALFSTFIEKDPTASNILIANLKKCNLTTQSRVLSYDAEKALSRCEKKKYAVSYIDPPYAKKGEKSTIFMVIALLEEYDLLQDNALIIGEDRYNIKEEIPSFKTIRFVKKKIFGDTSLWIFEKTTPKSE